MTVNRATQNTKTVWDPKRMVEEAGDLARAGEHESAALAYSVAADAYMKMQNYGEALNAIEDALEIILEGVRAALDDNVDMLVIDGVRFAEDLVNKIEDMPRDRAGISPEYFKKESDDPDTADYLENEAMDYFEGGNFDMFYHSIGEAVSEKLEKALDALESGDYGELSDCLEFIWNNVAFRMLDNYKRKNYRGTKLARIERVMRY